MYGADGPQMSCNCDLPVEQILIQCKDSADEDIMMLKIYNCSLKSALEKYLTSSRR